MKYLEIFEIINCKNEDTAHFQILFYAKYIIDNVESIFFINCL